MPTAQPVLPIPKGMAIDRERARKHLRKLRRSLKDTSLYDIPEQVHSLRSRSRRVEAVIHALQLDQHQQGSRLLKKIRPIRHQAGKVRDMDVLTVLAAAIPVDKEERECQAQLLEQLGAKRVKEAEELVSTVSKNGKMLRRRLKDCDDLVGKLLDASEQEAKSGGRPQVGMAACRLSTELQTWPRVTAKNVHPFRVKVKELAYILQLDDGGEAGRSVKALNETKDAIGDWHDWRELLAVATDLLGEVQGCGILWHIRSTTAAKLRNALQMVSRMRGDNLAEWRRHSTRG